MKLAQLRTALGDCCAHCHTPEGLEVDCIVPQGHEHHCAGIEARARFYIHQFAKHNVQLLCRQCHLVKTRQEAARSLMTNSEPF